MSLPWYAPPSYGVAAGPLITKCHSRMLSSRGAQAMCGTGSASSLWNSLRSRATHCFFAIPGGPSLTPPVAR